MTFSCHRLGRGAGIIIGHDRRPLAVRASPLKHVSGLCKAAPRPLQNARIETRAEDERGGPQQHMIYLDLCDLQRLINDCCNPSIFPITTQSCRLLHSTLRSRADLSRRATPSELDQGLAPAAFSLRIVRLLTPCSRQIEQSLALSTTGALAWC
ncbi:hypothetical protein M433DRAFT_196511 [Acidomyces richmondensis BFW]|nr:MAG: hypothetical protein FE78DRAFT_348315 [Acidomyces sp. 'richmondensis']KYG46547.1 hypothetical protein M433DRAFT_196511 [Acidomyces richmondensis BFW]